MTTCLGKNCSFGLPRVPFVNCCQFMYLVISLLVLRAGCGIGLYPFLIIVYLFIDETGQVNYSISILLVWRKMLTSFMYRLIWAESSEFGSYHLCEQRSFGRSCASAQSRQNLSCSLKQAMSQEEPSDRKPDPWPLLMTGHEQLKFFMTRNARRHKFAWRGPYSCASVNNNKKCAIGRSENERKSVLWGKMFIFVVAYMNMINDVGNLT